MATDFNGIIAADGFKVSKTDTPTRVGMRIETLDEMELIPNPFEGMIVYVKQEQEYYKVTSLKAKELGGISVDNALVDAYEPLIPRGIQWVDVS